jgi:Kef-type K+ transport system membrane component KefB
MSHPMTTIEIFLIAMGIIFTVPYLIWRLGRTEYFAPLVVVQIITGIVLGPGVLGAVAPAYYEFVFNPTVIQCLNSVAWWAVMLFVCIAGIELDLGKAWQNRRESGITAGLALGVPMILGSLAGLVLVQFPGWLGAKGLPWQFVAGIGMACAVTALPILMLFMEKLHIMRAPLGQRILRYASLDDIAIWGVLAIILLDWTRMGRQGIFLVVFTVATYLYRRLMQAVPESDRWFILLPWLALVGFAADWAGLHFMVGAFLAGAVTESRWFDQEKMDLLRHHVLMVLMPVFFLSTGLRTHWDMGGLEVFVVAGLLLAVSVSGKLVGVHVAGRILRWQPGEASIIGWLLQTKALIMIIFANVLLDKHIITSETFTALLLMAVGSTMLTIPRVTPLLRRFPAITHSRADSSGS